MRRVSLIVAIVVMAGNVGLAAPMSFDDVATGNWSAPATWGQATEYPGNDHPGDPPGPEADDVTIDGHLGNLRTVTGDIVIPTVVTPITVKTNGRLYFNNIDQSVDIILDGGTFWQRGYNSGSESDMYGDVTVLSDSTHYMEGHGNDMNANTAKLHGDIKDGATTGQLHMTGIHTTSLIMNGDNSGFSGGFLVDSPGSAAKSRCGLHLNSDGGLGTGTTTINTSVRVIADQTDSVARPAPAGVAVNSGGLLDIFNYYNYSVTVSGWNVTMADSARLNFGPFLTGKLDGTCSVAVNGDVMLYIRQDGRWNGTGEIAGPISGAGNILVKDQGANDSSQGGYDDWSRVVLSGNNVGLTGDIRVEKTPATLDPLDLILVAAAPNSLGSNNSVIIGGGAELEITDPNAGNGTNILYLLAGSAALLDLQDDLTVLGCNLGATYNGVSGEVEGGNWLAVGDYTSGLDPYVQFNGHTLTVLQNFGIVPEPAGLGLIGMALLGLRRKRS